MARRRRSEEHVNHEAWAIPYGDLVTLLLAFFVVMYAISSVNEGKYRVLSDSLVAAFRSAPKSLEPIQIGEMSKAENELQTRQPRTLVPLEMDQLPLDLLERIPEIATLQRAGFSPEEIDAAAKLIEEIDNAIVEALGDLVAQDLVRLRRDRFWIEIEINTSVLFPSGSADVSPEARPVLERLGTILAGNPVRTHVEGHTDERPINTLVFPSNWELSAARAARVVRIFQGQGVAPQRMAAVGLGEFHPIADNDTPSGRQENRRVVIVVMADRERIIDRESPETWRLPAPLRKEEQTGDST